MDKKILQKKSTVQNKSFGQIIYLSKKKKSSLIFFWAHIFWAKLGQTWGEVVRINLRWGRVNLEF